jgi:hypothetical protein
MTQPSQPRRLARPGGVNGPSGPSGPTSQPRGAGPAAPVDKTPFQYDTVSAQRPSASASTTKLPPPPDSATPASTLAPPGQYPPARPPAGTARPGPPPSGAPNGAPGAARRPAPGRAAAARSPRRARLQLRHINPWTVFKFACALSIALFFIWLLTIAVLYGILDATGVIHRINDAWTTVEGGDASAPIRPSIVLLGATVIGAVNIVLFIALSTIGSIIYNLCADIIGGIEVTLSEPET